MGVVTQTSTPRFQLQTFAPGWGATAMGTSVLAIAVKSATVDTSLAGVGLTAARVVLVIAALFLLVVVGVMTARWVKFPGAMHGDLVHPVKGGMSGTLPGGMLAFAVSLGNVGPGMLPDGVITALIGVLAAVGTTLALLFGWVFLGTLAAKGDTAMGMVTGAWFIPPVVTIITPLALSPLLSDDTVELTVLAWGLLGMGTFLYLLVAAALFLRSMTTPVPPAGLAPTLAIGQGPAGLIALNLLALAPDSEVARAASLMFWGAGIWWMVATVVVLARGYQKIPFALSWWGFTFPFGALTVASNKLGLATGSVLISTIGALTTVILIVLWLYVLLHTVSGIRKGTIWAH